MEPANCLTQKRERICQEFRLEGSLPSVLRGGEQELVGQPACRCCQKDEAVTGGNLIRVSVFENLTKATFAALLPNDSRRWLAQPHELRMRVGQARTGFAALVHERVHIREAFRACGLRPPAPDLRDEAKLLFVELGKAAGVSGHVHDHFLAFEGREEVWDNSHLPAGGVRIAQLLGKRKGLRRGAPFAPGAEWAGLELLLSRPLEGGTLGAWALGALWSDDDESTRERVAAKVAAQRPSSPMSGRKSSSGKGRMIVEERSELISSMV
jgi:hypothetical protein